MLSGSVIKRNVSGEYHLRELPAQCTFATGSVQTPSGCHRLRRICVRPLGCRPSVKLDVLFCDRPSTVKCRTGFGRARRRAGYWQRHRFFNLPS